MENNFTALLNRQPLPSEIAINSMANNSQYIPIGIVQNKLDEYFQGLWKTENFKSEVFQNEIIGSIELHVFHPVAQCWITRIGSASVMIQHNKENQKIKNTLVKDYPHLLSECIKSASKSLGAAFGRNLNKTVVDEYQPLIIESNENFDEFVAVERAIMESKTKDEVVSLYNGLTHLKENKQVKKIVQLRINQLKAS